MACACDRYHETTVELGFNYRESFNTFVIQARKGDLPHPSAPSLKRCRLQLGWAAFSFYPNDRRNCAFGGEVKPISLLSAPEKMVFLSYRDQILDILSRSR